MSFGHARSEPLFEAIGDTGGALLSGGFLTYEAGSAVDAEPSILEDAARVIVDAQAAEGRAIVAAMAAAADAADAEEVMVAGGLTDKEVLLMYVGGGAVVLILIVLVIVLLMRR